ncbi:MAG: radical SAM protein [Anaerolineales bacterium]|nr:radical SAM protein [Chloroflexota bacterium]MBL6982330.1 radical SAM protein [Anaerolineales bacterium]
MTGEEIFAALEATTYWEQPYQVHITGGEPFLKFSLLLHAVEAASELGIQVYAETNGGWCVSDDLVERRFSALRYAGMSALLISCSPFHAETIPPERTIMAIRKSLEIFGPQYTMVYLPGWLEQIQAFGSDTPTPLEAYVQVYGQEDAGRMFWQGYSLISGGRAGYRLGHLTPKQSPDSFREQSCQQELLYAQHSHFDLYGNFIPAFCGGLVVGDWHQLPHLIEDFQANNYSPLLKTLIEAGPYGLYEMAQETYGYSALENGYAGKCHLCVDVRRNLVEKGDFVELQPVEFYENF